MRLLKNVLKAFVVVIALFSTLYLVAVVFLSFFTHNYAEIHPEDYYDDDDYY